MPLTAKRANDAKVREPDLSTIRPMRCGERFLCALLRYLCVLRGLKALVLLSHALRLLDPDEFSGGGVHRDLQFCVGAARAVNYVPDQVVIHAIPLQNKHDGGVGFFGQ